MYLKRQRVQAHIGRAWRPTRANSTDIMAFGQHETGQCDMRMEENLAAHVLEILKGAAAAPLAERRAALDWSADESAGDRPAVVEIKPARPDAAPLVVAVDRPGEAYIDVGLHGTHFELWEREGEPFDRALRRIAVAVIDGRYEEWVRLGSGGRLIAAKGLFHHDAKRPEVVMHNTFGWLVNRRPGWTHIQYGPY